MGKKSKAPSYSSGSVVVNGRTVATSNKSGNNISTHYNMSDAEKNIFNSIQQGMNSGLTNLFNISDTERKQWDNQLNAPKEQGIENINSIYSPMENSLKNDIASRFGNLDNSVFLDKLNAITNNKAKAVASLSNNLAATQNDLYTEELNNRMNTLSLLNNINTALNNNILNYTNAAAANSAAGNSYNQAMMQQNSSNWFNDYVKPIASTASTIASFI